jgi:hypothetical protein
MENSPADTISIASEAPRHITKAFWILARDKLTLKKTDFNYVLDSACASESAVPQRDKASGMSDIHIVIAILALVTALTFFVLTVTIRSKERYRSLPPVGTYETELSRVEEAVENVLRFWEWIDDQTVATLEPERIVVLAKKLMDFHDMDRSLTPAVESAANETEEEYTGSETEEDTNSETDEEADRIESEDSWKMEFDMASSENGDNALRFVNHRIEDY